MSQPPSHSHPQGRLLDAVVRLDDLPQMGRHIKVRANEDERNEIARRLDVVSVERLEAELLARPLRGGVEVKGRLLAEVTQACVVSFEPVAEAISEPVDRVFMPGHDEKYEGPAGAEVFVDLENDTIPDRFDGSEVDLSELLVETLSLALDPYPRHPDAHLPAQNDPDKDQMEASPFAKLKTLKPSGD